MRQNMRLDSSHCGFPSGMKEYLDTYGWHFSKKMCEWAVSMMRKRNPQTGKEEPVDYMDKEKVEEALKKAGVTLSGVKGYDHIYVFHMAKSDYMKSSIADDAHLALFVKDYLEDTDGYPEVAFTRFYADCIGSGTPIEWSDCM